MTNSTSIYKNSLVKKALKFAEEKHKNQFRKDNKTPYIEHPKRVAEIVRKFKKSHNIEALISAALLHDTLEDTDTNIAELSQNFGGLIALLVLELTSDKEAIKRMGKENYLAMKLKSPKKVSDWGLVIKLADRLDNIRDINGLDKKFKKKYIKETKKIIQSLEKERKLSNTHKKLINEIKKEIKKSAFFQKKN